MNDLRHSKPLNLICIVNTFSFTVISLELISKTIRSKKRFRCFYLKTAVLLSSHDCSHLTQLYMIGLLVLPTLEVVHFLSSAKWKTFKSINVHLCVWVSYLLSCLCDYAVSFVRYLTKITLEILDTIFKNRYQLIGQSSPKKCIFF